MANTLKNQLNTMINRRRYFEGVLLYLSHTGESRAEMEELFTERTDELMHSFSQYKGIWDSFCEFTLNGEYDKAIALMNEYRYETEMGPTEQKSVLFVLAETTGNYNTFHLYWQLIGEETVEAHESALRILSDCLPDCPEALPEIKNHFYWLINHTEKREQFKYLETGLKLYMRPRPLFSTSVASDIIYRIRAQQPKHKEANKAEMQIIRRDYEILEIIRPLVDQGQQQEAIDKTIDRGSELVRRAFVRGAFENKTNPEQYIEALKLLYECTNDPEDEFYAAYAVWNCPLKQDEDYLRDSMERAERAIAKIEAPNHYIATYLDQLYLIEPYPLEDEKAVKYAKIILSTEPENDIAKEVIAIANEQMNG